MVEFFSRLLPALAISTHHILDLFSLFDGSLKVPLLRLKLLIFLFDRFDFLKDFLDFLLVQSNSLLSLLSDFFDLLFEGT